MIHRPIHRGRPTALALQARESDLHGQHQADQDQQRQRFTIIVEAQPHETPAAIRIRQLLKIALRGFGMKCVSVEQASLTGQKSPKVLRRLSGVRGDSSPESFPHSKAISGRLIHADAGERGAAC